MEIFSEWFDACFLWMVYEINDGGDQHRNISEKGDIEDIQ